MTSQAQGRTRMHRFLTIAGSLALVGATAACAAKVDQKAPKPEQTTQAQELSPRAKQHWRGPVGVVIDVTRQYANLSPEQTERVDTIAKELEQDHQSRNALHDRLRTSAVNVVRSGTADTEEFNQSVNEAVSAVEQHMQRSADALEEIHAILEPAQRSAVAVALRQRIAEKFGKSPDQKPHREGFKRFASDLMLSKLQIEQLATIKKELLGEKQQLHPTREELLALVDAFESDDLMTPLDTFREKKAQILRSRVADAGKRADRVLSIFTPQQRELLADLILDGPAKVLLGPTPADTPPRTGS